jgi:hypothetical protein
MGVGVGGTKDGLGVGPVGAGDGVTIPGEPEARLGPTASGTHATTATAAARSTRRRTLSFIRADRMTTER